MSLTHSSGTRTSETCPVAGSSIRATIQTWAGAATAAAEPNPLARRAARSHAGPASERTAGRIVRRRAGETDMLHSFPDLRGPRGPAARRDPTPDRDRDVPDQSAARARNHAD